MTIRVNKKELCDHLTAESIKKGLYKMGRDHFKKLYEDYKEKYEIARKKLDKINHLIRTYLFGHREFIIPEDFTKIVQLSEKEVWAEGEKQEEGSE